MHRMIVRSQVFENDFDRITYLGSNNWSQDSKPLSKPSRSAKFHSYFDPYIAHFRTGRLLSEGAVCVFTKERLFVDMPYPLPIVTGDSSRLGRLLDWHAIYIVHAAVRCQCIPSFGLYQQSTNLGM